MKPGREFDALVAEKVMGMNVQSSPETAGSGTFNDPMILGSKPVYYDAPKGALVRGFGKDVPSFSTDIAAAWEVVEKLAAGFSLESTHDGRWTAHFYVPIGVATCDAPAEAICRAALEAVGHTLK